ncbi:CrcB family protein [Arenibaculum sp.]|jgi:CrcB protein|uniref:fluoride efflux transporter FluC n=1 Tax=Arenibaculum sp. TaxID=2865862 RepID=UPI002E12ABF6|nr:CrcB family protein [Arenibaculum sp.]
MVRLYLAVGLGSALGGGARWLASDLLAGWLGTGSLLGTLFVNVTGSWLIGLYAALAAPGGRFAAGPLQRHFMMAGVCGGYTTFSVFSLETVRLVEAGRPGMAAAYVGMSVAGWLAAVWAGYGLGTRVNRAGG